MSLHLCLCVFDKNTEMLLLRNITIFFYNTDRNDLEAQRSLISYQGTPLRGYKYISIYIYTLVSRIEGIQVYGHIHHGIYMYMYRSWCTILKVYHYVEIYIVVYINIYVHTLVYRIEGIQLYGHIPLYRVIYVQSIGPLYIY